MKNIILFELTQYDKDPNYMGDFPLLKELACNPYGYYEVFAHGISKKYKTLESAIKFLNITFEQLNLNSDRFQDITADLIIDCNENSNIAGAEFWRKQYKSFTKKHGEASDIDIESIKISFDDEFWKELV